MKQPVSASTTTKGAKVKPQVFDELSRQTFWRRLSHAKLSVPHLGGARAGREAGTPCRRPLSYRGVTVASWTAFEVINGPPAQGGACQHDFLPIPTCLRTPREAVACSYGRADHHSRAGTENVSSTGGVLLVPLVQRLHHSRSISAPYLFLAYAKARLLASNPYAVTTTLLTSMDWQGDRHVYSPCGRHCLGAPVS